MGELMDNRALGVGIGALLGAILLFLVEGIDIMELNTVKHFDDTIDNSILDMEMGYIYGKWENQNCRYSG